MTERVTVRRLSGTTALSLIVVIGSTLAIAGSWLGGDDGLWWDFGAVALMVVLGIGLRRRVASNYRAVSAAIDSLLVRHEAQGASDLQRILVRFPTRGTASSALNALVIDAITRGSFARAVQLAEQGQVAAKGLPQFQTSLTINLALALAAHGQPEDAIARLEKIRADDLERSWAAMAALTRAFAHYHAGRHAEALAILTESRLVLRRSLAGFGPALVDALTVACAERLGGAYRGGTPPPSGLPHTARVRSIVAGLMHAAA